MPEVTFDIVWPDGSQEQFYSPSTVVNQYFQTGKTYELQDFVRRSQESLNLASERVRQRYGSPCSMAIAQLRKIETKAVQFDEAAAQVKIL
ncbi:hypothetical protein Lepto7376_1526 [[Leptolyngbya] sp. PCC 7376]|uniref:MSMEG_0570 family nitrogen starvation response protein n=1 Tax=[Leptolyngbya] sp. PCC 7376 TaxID=111781 RepID=UPI00029ECB88|nr:MSMEG_0570 family nitrogen starvation response protein [[Leptolyngbya] sp. PCC 7376]AFY37869.1 hypothetical protein Lepto7376_1526 [[Leptolyngbya] sp. PCC 7376]